jgi:hypothetical protein
MRGEIRSIEANDLHDWPHWRPTRLADERQWFTVTIGPPGSAGGDLFQVCVASVAFVRQPRASAEFDGLTVEHFTPESVERAIHEFVASVEAGTWPVLAAALAPTMKWEYERMAGTE